MFPFFEGDKEEAEQSPSKRRKTGHSPGASSQAEEAAEEEDDSDGNSSEEDSSDEASNKKEEEVKDSMGSNGEAIDLTERMNKFSLSAEKKVFKAKKKTRTAFVQKGHLSMDCPYLFYRWRDEQKNTMFTLEILMPGPLNDKNCNVELVEKGGGQVVSVTYNLPNSWVNEDHFTRNNEVESWNGSRKFEARCESIKILEDSFGQGRKALLVYQQDFELPVRCDNFDKEPVYKGTGFRFQQWPLLSRSSRPGALRVNNTTVDGMIDVLIVELVAEDKFQATKKSKKTPQKQVLLGTFDDDEEEQDSRGGVHYSFSQQRQPNFSFQHQESFSSPPTANRPPAQRRRMETRSRSRSRNREGSMPMGAGVFFKNLQSQPQNVQVPEEEISGGPDVDVGQSFETAGADMDDESMNTSGLSFN